MVAILIRVVDFGIQIEIGIGIDEKDGNSTPIPIAISISTGRMRSNLELLVDGISVGSLIVHVVYIDFDGPVACQVGYKREKGVAVYGPTDQVFFTAKDPALLEVSVKEVTSYGVRLYLKALGRGTPVVQARLGSATGPILAEQESLGVVIRH